jgi:anti-sigma-K factor RskA
LSGAYALGALSAGEKAAYEAFLAESADAREEASSLAEAAAELALAAEPVAPTPELKASILAQLAQTPQLPPLSEPSRSMQHPEAVEKQTASPAQAKANSRWLKRAGVILAAAAVAAGLFIGGNLVGQQSVRSDFAVSQATALAQLQTAADAQQASVEVAGGGEATLIWSLEQRRSVLMIDGLKPLPRGETYQLWYMGKKGATPAGTFEAADSGASWRVLDGQMSGGDTVGVTVEPAGGSKQPTGDPIVAIESA